MNDEYKYITDYNHSRYNADTPKDILLKWMRSVLVHPLTNLSEMIDVVEDLIRAGNMDVAEECICALWYREDWVVLQHKKVLSDKMDNCIALFLDKKGCDLGDMPPVKYFINNIVFVGHSMI